MSKPSTILRALKKSVKKYVDANGGMSSFFPAPQKVSFNVVPAEWTCQAYGHDAPTVMPHKNADGQRVVFISTNLSTRVLLSNAAAVIAINAMFSVSTDGGVAVYVTSEDFAPSGMYYSEVQGVFMYDRYGGVHGTDPWRVATRDVDGGYIRFSYVRSGYSARRVAGWRHESAEVRGQLRDAAVQRALYAQARSVLSVTVARNVIASTEARQSSWFLGPDPQSYRPQQRITAERERLAGRRRLGGLITRFINGADDLGCVVDALNEDGMDVVPTSRALSACRDHGGYISPCCSCGSYFNEDDMVSVHNGDMVCDGCADEDYVNVEDGADLYPVSDVFLWEDGLYRTYEEPDEDDYEAEDGNNAGCIRGYSTNVLGLVGPDVSTEESSFGEFLMGIELEVSPQRGYRVPCARDVHRNLCPDYAVLKNDGSLEAEETDDFAQGFEIVTAPRFLSEHIRRFSEWEPHEHLRAWDAGCCGMHIHLSSRGFSPAAFGKFVEFINSKDNDGLIMEIAGRHPDRNDQAAQYCQRDGVPIPGNPKATAEAKSWNRYRMVNVQNLSYDEAVRLGMPNPDRSGRDINTIELRIFRATLNKKRLLAQIEFAHAAVMFCRWTSMRQLRREHFLAWLRDMAGVYPHLARWFGVAANKKTVDEHPKAREVAEV